MSIPLMMETPNTGSVELPMDILPGLPLQFWEYGAICVSPLTLDIIPTSLYVPRARVFLIYFILQIYLEYLIS